MPDDSTPLLQEVCEQPGSLEARGIYADWLTEHGDPRGEFIALQLQLAAMSPLDPDYPSIDAQSQRLERRHARRWLKEILSEAALDAEEYSRIELDELQNAQFKNGFLERIALSPQSVLDHWSSLQQQEPVAGVELVVFESIPSGLADTNIPESWRSLKISPNGWLTTHEIREILFWNLRRLESLDLSGCDLGVNGAKLLANEPIEMDDTDGLFVPPHPIDHSCLTSLSVRNSGISDDGLKILLAPHHIHGLKRLDISQCRIVDSESLQAMLPLEQLEDLRLAGNNTLDLAPLVAWKTLGQLRCISLPQSLDPSLLAKLFPAPSPHLQSLDIASAKSLLSDGLESVVSVAEDLVHLNIGATSAGDKSFAALIAAPPTAKLNSLHAYRCSLSDKAIDALVQRSDSRLVRLDLSSNKLSDAALKLLAEWPGLRNIAHLRLGNNRKLTAAGYAALIDVEDFEPAILDLGTCKDKQLVAALAERFPEAVRTNN